MKKNGYTLRPINDAGAGLHYPEGAVIEGMSAGQFEDWKASGMVREATSAEVKGETPAPLPAPPMGEQALANPPAPPAPPKAKSKRSRKDA